MCSISALDTIPDPRVPPIYSCPALTTTSPPQFPTPAVPSPSHPHSLSLCSNAIQTTIHASHSPKPSHPHRVPRQPHRQTSDDHTTTHTTNSHRPSSKSERNLIILQVNINGIKTNSRNSKCLFTTHMQMSSHLQLHTSQYKQKIQHPSQSLHKHLTYFNTPRLSTIFHNGRYTTNISTVTITDIKQTCALYICLCTFPLSL